MRIHWLQHVPFEGLGAIGEWADAHGHVLTLTRLFANEPLPIPSDFDWLIVMGGPMSAYDDKKISWLAAEKRCIEKSIARGKTVLGVCLGSQLIASVLGAKVYPNRQKEIGWFPVRVTPEGQQSKLFGGFGQTVPTFHWHGDTFNLPKGAVRMAETDACANQAFIFGDNVVGLQFHWEISAGGAAELIANCRQELVEAPFIQSVDRILAADNPFVAINRQMTKLLDRLSGTREKG